MTISVLLFASWADALGSTVEIELPEGATVADLLGKLRKMAGDKVLPRPMVAVNHDYAAPGTVISPSDEIALIPPVAGG